MKRKQIDTFSYSNARPGHGGRNLACMAFRKCQETRAKKFTDKGTLLDLEFGARQVNWFLENLLLVGILGAVSLVASFVRLRLDRPIRWLMFLGLALLGIVFAGAAYVAFFSTPDEDDTVVVDLTVPSDEIEASPILNRLTESWDSDKREADWPVCETLAILSNAAYLPPYDADAEYERLGFKKVVPIVAQSMIGYIVINDESTVICFRGTDFTEVADWIANLDRSSTDVRNGRIHRGFYNAYISLKPQVESVLADHPTEHLWITGHSLGGALALVCAFDFMEYERRNFDGIITFGQPKVARRDLADYLDNELAGRYARVVNGSDLVSRIPPSHAYCGSLVWFNGDRLERSKPKRVVRGSANGPMPAVSTEDDVELPEMSERDFEDLQQELQGEDTTRATQQSQVSYRGNTRIIDDHNMDLYVDRIRNHLGLSDTP